MGVKLTEVADIIPRSDGQTDYPQGTILVQIAAVSNTSQYIRYLPAGGKIDGKNPDKYAVVLPSEEVNSRYLYELMKWELPQFYRRYRQGLNLVGEHLKFMRLPPLADKKQQDVICDLSKLL